MSSTRLDGRTVIVTGASQGIGREIAVTFASEGASVVVADVKAEPLEAGDPTTVELIEDAGGDGRYERTDVTDGDSVAATIEDTVAAFGGLDVLVNNAGIFRNLTLEETTEDDWDRVIDVNLTGVFRCCKHAMPHLTDSEYPRIVSIASKRGLVGHEGGVPYAVSKGGIVALTRQLAVDYGDDGVCVNAIAPGTIITGADPNRLSGPDDFRVRMTLLPYLGEPGDVARAALYLASDDGRFVTGQTLVVDGGWTAH